MAKAKRPAGATVIAVFNLLFGLPCLCCAGISSGGSLVTAMDKGNNQNAFKIDEKEAAKNDILKSIKQSMEEQEFVQKEVSHFYVANFVMYGIGTVASLLLFISGIVLLTMRNSGRWICILGAVLLLTNAVSDMVYSAAFVYPATQKFQEKQRREGKSPDDDAAVSALIAPGAFLVLGGGYAILAIAVMLSGATRVAYAAAARAGRSHDDEFDRPPEDYDAYDQRRDFDDRFRRHRDDFDR